MRKFSGTSAAAGALAALCLFGCASAPDGEGKRTTPPPEVFHSVRPDNLPPAYTYDKETYRRPPRHAPQLPLPSPKTLREADAGPVADGWEVSLTAGQRRAYLNGIEIWLCEPAVHGRDAKGRPSSKFATATAADQRWTLDPLLRAPTNAFVRAPRNPRIVIDPGHGGTDPGTQNAGKRESAIVLDVARRLSTYLTLSGYEVRITRPDDKTTVPLEARSIEAATWPADLFVSIHLNSGPSAARGIETYAIPPAGLLSTEMGGRTDISAAERAAAGKKESGNDHDLDNIRLAWCIHRRLVAATGLRDRGVRRARFTVLRNAPVPAVLVEIGFLSHSGDAAFYDTVAGREKAAIGICRGVMDFCAGHVAPTHPALPIGPTKEEKP